MSRKFIASSSTLAALALVVASCGGGDGGTDGGNKVTGEVKEGGTLRIAASAFPVTGAFDPTSEYLGNAWSFYSQALLRTLVTYRFVEGDAGNEVVPDMAQAMPDVSDDGLVYTFKLRTGVKWSPPINREVTSKDFVTAIERMATKGLAAYGNYYGTPPSAEIIKGIHDFYEKRADTITGVEAPDDYTLRITLARPTADFLFRMAMPAVAAMPEEITRCFTTNGSMGGHVVSNGPYMIEGTDRLDMSSCSTLRRRPISGFSADKGMTLVRNPNWDKATDPDQIRPAYAERIEFTINSNRDDIFKRIEQNELDASFDTPPPATVQKYFTNPQLKPRMHTPSGDRTWFLVMNLTEPPFDDVHVRKAVNLIVDKAGLHRVWGGPPAGEIATHILPPIMVGNKLGQDYDPYNTPNFAGDETKAKEEMKQSKYDTNKDGLCDASACKDVLHINRNTPPQVDMSPVVEASLRKIGITLDTRETENHYPLVGAASTKFGIASNAGWGKDFADPVTYSVNFDGRTLTEAEDNEAAVGNYAYVGLTQDLARKIGIDYPEGGVPNVDADIDRCIALAGDERVNCWIDFDKKLMEQVVPWVPYLWGNNIDVVSEAVTQYEFDQFATEMSFVRMAVDPTKQK